MNGNLHLRELSVVLTAAVGSLLVSCASVPRDNPQLDLARTAVASAHSDTHVTGDALVELGKADAALSAGDSMLLAQKPMAEVDHEAYLADRYARAAQAHGNVLYSERRIAELANRRNAVLLAARDNEVRHANAVADDMTLEAKNARSDAASSAVDTAAAVARADQLDAQLTEMQGQRTDRGVVVTLGDVLFASGQSTLQEGSGRSIERLTAFLSAHPSRTVRIEGFTDSVGGVEFNRALSERRAMAVSDALTHGGIDPARIRTEGYGEAFAVAGNGTVVGRQQNRRVEVIISNDNLQVSERTR